MQKVNWFPNQFMVHHCCYLVHFISCLYLFSSVVHASSPGITVNHVRGGVEGAGAGRPAGSGGSTAVSSEHPHTAGCCHAQHSPLPHDCCYTQVHPRFFYIHMASYWQQKHLFYFGSSQSSSVWEQPWWRKFFNQTRDLQTREFRTKQ